ncbi:small ribosomal subunit protein cS22 [Aristolochia californica]|uniref:small ribosomal subunit protein cS22 n=1 Tax=Aristolochia californica TaxID=171875 RepID=UPI0035E203FA
MATISFLLSSNLFQQPSKIQTFQTPTVSFVKTTSLPGSYRFRASISFSNTRKAVRTSAVAEEAALATQDPSSEAARRVYVGNIPRTVDNEQLKQIFEEHCSVVKAEVMYDKYTKKSRRFGFVTVSTVEDANLAIEKLNDTEVGGRQIKVNITEKPLASVDLSLIQADDSTFVDSPYKVYVGNLAKTVTSDTLTKFFSEKGKVLSAKVSRSPGTSKTSGFGFVSFSSDEEVEAAITDFNNALLEGQSIRVNRA